MTEEVRRDRLYGYLRRFGWIAVLLVLLIVGGAAWREYSRADAEMRAEEFGSAVLAALDAEAPEARVAALRDIAAPEGDARAVLAMLIAAEQAEAGETAAAAATLSGIEAPSDIYRQIAAYKAAGAPEASVDEQRIALEALAQSGPLRLLAEERLALAEIAAGDTEAAIARLVRIRDDAEVTQGLRRRAGQLIVALGGEPDAS
ncbi:hypothetical protein [Roseivivax sp. CAU 1761]